MVHHTKVEHTEFPLTHTSYMHRLMECMSICAACAKKCIEEGHKKTAALCVECADMCALTIKSISCQSEFNRQLTDLCAQVCQRCGEECNKMKVQHCQECTEACKRATDACKDFLRICG